MKHPSLQLLLPLVCLLPLTLPAQTQIGGGTCSSASLQGLFAMTLTGRQLTSAGTFSSVLQGNGAANFDGQSKVTMTLNVDTLKGVGTPLTYSGTYSVQANCAGLININTGDTASFNLLIYNRGGSFLLTGADSSYAYTGGGSNQPSNGCTTAKLAGVYTINTTGYAFTSGAVSGIENGVGLAQFDGVGAVTVNATLSTLGASSAALALKGTYSIASTCLGSAALTDSSGTAYVMNFSITGNSAVAVTGLDLTLSQASKFILSGAGHPVYGQPTADAAEPRARRLRPPNFRARFDNSCEGERA